MKKLLAIGALLVGVAGGAFAQASFAEGAFGRGMAQEPSGRRAEFDFEVVKRTFGDSVRLNGRFLFDSSMVVEGRPARVTIRMGELVRLDRGGNVCEFSGRAVLVLRRGDATREIRGIVQVRVADRRVEGQGEPDQIAVRFIAGNANQPMFSFAGTVARGDIVVFRRQL